MNYKVFGLHYRYLIGLKKLISRKKVMIVFVILISVRFIHSCVEFTCDTSFSGRTHVPVGGRDTRGYYIYEFRTSSIWKCVLVMAQLNIDR